MFLFSSFLLQISAHILSTAMLLNSLPFVTVSDSGKHSTPKNNTNRNSNTQLNRSFSVTLHLICFRLNCFLVREIELNFMFDLVLVLCSRIFRNISVKADFLCR
jgi:hypothetical protein